MTLDMAKNQTSPPGKVMIFTIALNGYQWHYRSLIKSHVAYAKKNNYAHTAVSKPCLSLLGLEVAWLKIRLIIEALNAGYAWVIFLDADTQVTKTAPPIEHIAKADKDIYVCRGFSGRINSGVLIIRNTLTSRDFFTTVLHNALKPIPFEDDVGWGENGHIIHFAKQVSCFDYLDSRWNNNHDPSMNDYIRHFSRGPIYHLFRPCFIDYLLGKAGRYSLAIAKRILCLFDNKHPQPSFRLSPDFHLQLEELTNKVLSHYPLFLKS